MRKDTIVLSVKIILTLTIFWFLFHDSQLQFGLLKSVWQHPLDSLVVIILCLLMVVLHAWRWYRLNVAQRIDLSLWQTMLPAYVAIAFNNVLPGSIGGDFFRLYYVVKKFPAQKSKTILTIFVDRLSGLFGVLLIACITATFYLDQLYQYTVLSKLVWVSITVCLMSPFLFLIAMYLISENNSWGGKIETWLQKYSVTKHFLPLLHGLRVYRNAKLILLESIMTSIGTQLLLLGSVWLIGRMMGLPEISPGLYLLALAMGQVASLLPITPGGLGVGEAAFGNIILLLTNTTYPFATVYFGLRILSTLAYLPGVFIGAFAFNLLHQPADRVRSNSLP